jgi:hypothetical protein
MNKLTALISTIVLGASSAAMASPTTVTASAHATVRWGNTMPAARQFSRTDRRRPIVVRPRPRPAPIVRDHRWDTSYDDYYNAGYTVSMPTQWTDYEPGYFQPASYQQPAQNVTLATGISFAGTRGHMELDVRAANGYVRGIHVDALNQSVILSHVLVTYTNGQEQMISVSRELAGGQSLDVSFNSQGRSVARVDIFQTSSTDLVGPSAGQFNVTTI